MAVFKTMSKMREHSDVSLPKNVRRTGVLKKRSSTRNVVPRLAWMSSFSTTSPPLTTMRPLSPSSVALVMVNLDTAAIEATASPRKPFVWRWNKSSAFVNLDVVWRKKQSSKSSAPMPFPLSVTWIFFFPPCSI